MERVPVESPPDVTIQLPGKADMAVQPFQTRVAGDVKITPMIAGEFADLDAVVSEIADQRLEQTMRAYFAMVNDVTQWTGNVVDAHGDATEGLLAALEKQDIHFDRDGNPELMMVVSPADADRIRAQLEGATLDQQRRFNEIISRKREAYRASRRRRRLPRHSH
jgi:hypothetical protein